MIEIIVGFIFLISFWYGFRELCYRIYLRFGSENLKRMCELDAKYCSGISLKTHVTFHFIFYIFIGLCFLIVGGIFSYGVGSMLLGIIK